MTNPPMRKADLTFRYIAAILAAFAALLLRQLLTPFLGHENPYHTVWLAVVFAAWYCGVGPSIANVLTSAMGVWFYLLPEFWQTPHDRRAVFGMLGFLIFSSGIIALGESSRRGLAIRSRLAAIVESSDDAIVSKNLNGVINSWNAGAERIFGFTAEQAIGQSINIIVPAELREEEKGILAKLRAGQRIDHFETIRCKKDGSRVHVSLTISPLRNSRGRVVGASKIARDITEQKRAKEAIKQAEISARLLHAQEEERRRIARELHDSVGQLLAAISMDLWKIANEKASLSPAAAQAVEDNLNLIDQVSSEIRTVSYLLHPPLLDEMGLPAALKWYVDGFTERSKIAGNVEVADDLGRLPKDQEICLFRIAQECLTNIHRHSGSATALLKLWRMPGEVRMEVSDEGQGIDPEIQAKVAAGDSAGVGLRGMQERVRQIGGTLEVHSNGKGTSILVTLPAAHPPASPDEEHGAESGKAKPLAARWSD